MSYKCISNFGPRADPTHSPLTYCLLETLDAPLMNGSLANTISGAHSSNCQSFMASRCANKWDGACEFASLNKATRFPNTLENCNWNTNCNQKLTSGQILIRNTASRKYLTQMNGNCSLKWQPFDPTVASSPMISKWSGNCSMQGNNGCIPTYEVDPKQIDNDHVMNKILQQPKIALDILTNIYYTAIRKNTLNSLKGTKIYHFFMSQPFQNLVSKK
jgi:hypothetical protein